MATKFGSLRLLFAGLQYGTRFIFELAPQCLENLCPLFYSIQVICGCEAPDKVM